MVLVTLVTVGKLETVENAPIRKPGIGSLQKVIMLGPVRDPQLLVEGRVSKITTRETNCVILGATFSLGRYKSMM